MAGTRKTKGARLAPPVTSRSKRGFSVRSSVEIYVLAFESGQKMAQLIWLSPPPPLSQHGLIGVRQWVEMPAPNSLEDTYSNAPLIRNLRDQKDNLRGPLDGTTFQ